MIATANLACLWSENSCMVLIIILKIIIVMTIVIMITIIIIIIIIIYLGHSTKSRYSLNKVT